MSADLLRRAASLMRERAEALLKMRDTCAEIGSGHYERQVHRHGGGPTFGAHFNGWNPTVALAAADQLDGMAAVIEEAEGSPLAIVAAGLAEKSVAVARAYLGEEADV